MKSVSSESDRTPSNDEKKIGVEAGGFEARGYGELPPDPDAGMSEAEKARIVSSRRHIPAACMADHSSRINSFSGNSTSS